MCQSGRREVKYYVLLLLVIPPTKNIEKSNVCSSEDQKDTTKKQIFHCSPPMFTLRRSGTVVRQATLLLGYNLHIRLQPSTTRRCYPRLASWRFEKFRVATLHGPVSPIWP